MRKNYQIVGGGISFFIHAVCIYTVILMSSALCNFKPPLMIDFSIVKSIGGVNAPQAAATKEHKPEDPLPEIKELPPGPDSVADDNKITAEMEHKEVLPAPEIKPVVPIDIPLPNREKVVKEEDEPVVPEKVIVEKQPPKVAELVEVPDHAIEKKIVPENVKKQVKVSKEILPDQSVVSEYPAVGNLEKSMRVKSSAPLAVPVVSKPSPLPKEKYMKENFLYIKERVQSKIVYPRIARKMGWQGSVLISFVICKDGTVKDVRIVKSSGFKALDNNAVKSIREAAPFPKPPVSAEIIFPVTYKLS